MKLKVTTIKFIPGKPVNIPVPWEVVEVIETNKSWDPDHQYQTGWQITLLIKDPERG